VFYGGGHGGEDGGMMQFVTNHFKCNNLIPVENMLRNLTIASNGRIYVLAIYDMCRTDLRGADGLSAGVDRA